jgi:hypothetical protein
VGRRPEDAGVGGLLQELLEEPAAMLTVREMLERDLER